MASGINEFRTNFGGVRPNRFRVNVSPPADNAMANTTAAISSDPAGLGNFDIYCKATVVPGSSIGVIPTPWMGRVVKFSGERTYADWTVQVYDSSLNANDSRTFFEKWIDEMDSRDTHDIAYKHVGSASVHWDDIVGTSGVGTHNKQTFQKSLTMINLFPIDISTMELSYDAVDTFAEYTITFAYDYWIPTAAGT